ncbi:hypothetical protein [Streptomyces sp. NPDC051219]|uniref:hypothetical protein n=1 Tax=Streptomyces sp. NPDC051219 TaxID=3155283 RepID=UPI00343991A4
MQTISGKSGPAGHGVLPVLAGAAAAVGGVGAVLAVNDSESLLRAPFALFFLITMPATAIGSALSAMELPARLVASTAGAVTVNLLIAQVMSAMNTRSVGAGIASVAAVSALLFLPAILRAHERRVKNTET